MCKSKEEKKIITGKVCNLRANLGLDIERKDSTVDSGRKTQVRSWELREMSGGQTEDSMEEEG